MKSLTKMSCNSCDPDQATITIDEEYTYLKELRYWKVNEIEGSRRLKRVYNFPDFREAMLFTNKIAELAEIEGHHPAIKTEYGQVTVIWWSHKLGGLHKNDFVMAAKTDRINELDLNEC